VDLLEKDQDFCKLLFQVKDTGIGISEDKIEHIFDPFVQEDESIKDKFGGTGLGLSIVKEFVELMGGKISVQSRKNEGTVFEVILSFNIPVKQHNREKIEDIHRYINFKESNILILEDNLINQEIIKGYLNDYKTLKITFKQNGKEGLKEVKNKKYDLIMSDIMMPEMDGKEFCKRFREIDKITPLIALTAFDDSKEIEELKKIGYNFIISKPYKKDELINGLSNYIAINEIFSDEKKLIDLAEKAKNSDKIDRFKKLFLMDLKDRYAELKYGIEKKDKEKMKFFCHNLKGIAPTLGYPEFAELAEKASALYKEDKWEELLIIKDEFFKNLELIEKSL
ncbi:MAG: response regulator, partial [Exilispira sp.]